MLETILILGFIAVITVLTTAGWVLFLFFWLRRLPRATRSLAAALLGSGGLLVPLLLLGGGSSFGSEAMAVILVSVSAAAALIGLPTALLANRKLERMGASAAATFE